MVVWTDTELTFTVQGLDLTTISQPHVTFSQGCRQVTKTDIDIIDSDHFQLILTQEDTSNFREGEIELQLNYINSRGLRRPSKKKTLLIEDNLLKEPIHDT